MFSHCVFYVYVWGSTARLTPTLLNAVRTNSYLRVSQDYILCVSRFRQNALQLNCHCCLGQ